MLALVFIGNIEYCPYLEKYKKVLLENEIEFEVLFWNRDGSESKYPCNYISFNKKSALHKKKIYKLLDFIQFERWLKKRIKMKKYDKLIILDTLSGILLAKILFSEYKYKYIFDIRDYSYERIKPFYQREEKIINLSYFTCISSEGFKKFLPKCYDYVIAHNFNYYDLSIARPEFSRKKAIGDTINIVWIGSVRYYDHQVNIIKKLKNDSRFKIIFHGTGPDLNRLMEYSQNNEVQNIEFTGRYNNNEKALLLSNVDIINNSYDVNVGYEVRYAISNRYYDGLIFGIPQLVETNTYKQHKIEEMKVGIGLDLEREDFADKLYEYYFSIDENEFNSSSNKEIKTILKEDTIYLEKLRDFIKD